MSKFVIVLLALSALSAGQGKQTFTGIITDDVCAGGGHGGMRMGPTDAECARLCVMVHDAAYVLYDGKEVYKLSDQETPEHFAAQKVTVVGTLNAATRTIEVESMSAAR